MDVSEPSLPHYKKTLHSKRSFGKYPKSADSPAYDASEEDNDPLTDDGASAISIPIARHSAAATAATGAATARSSAHSKASSRARHQLASSLLSDDGVDSPTYDGDIESSTTPGKGHTDHHPSSKSYMSHHHNISSTSTLSTPITSAFAPQASGQSTPGDTVSSPPRSANPDSPRHPVFISQPVNAAAIPLHVLEEPLPVAEFNPAALTQDDIQIFVQMAIDGTSSRKYKINKPPVDRPVRIYADGVYDLFHFGHALQLRQAKLSFPSVYLMVGVCSDELVKSHKSQSVMTHAERQRRCESARHCRWVDEIVQDAPWVIDAEFMEKWEIDYVAHDDDPYAAVGHDDVYAFVKSQGKFIPTRRTPGVSTSELLERIVLGYRKRDFDEKLVKMGHAELKAEGSDFDERSRPQSRIGERSIPASRSPSESPKPVRVRNG